VTGTHGIAVCGVTAGPGNPTVLKFPGQGGGLDRRFVVKGKGSAGMLLEPVVPFAGPDERRRLYLPVRNYRFVRAFCMDGKPMRTGKKKEKPCACDNQKEKAEKEKLFYPSVSH
ncbi:MAG: hypothetical protein R6V03_10240, partial [Kiritimatiellia bacterium]